MMMNGKNYLSHWFEVFLLLIHNNNNMLFYHCPYVFTYACLGRKQTNAIISFPLGTMY
jgi:hypothetical protein